jgi:hypothetical protein
MAKGEENAWKHFEELKRTLPKLSLSQWKKDFKSYIDKFIADHLFDKHVITLTARLEEGEEGWELDPIHLHRIWRLVAGAIQEWELVQQPKHAAAYAEIDGALIWQGRGYVSLIHFAISLLQPSFQSQFEKVSPALWLVVSNPYYKFIFFPLVVYGLQRYLAIKNKLTHES